MCFQQDKIQNSLNMEAKKGQNNLKWTNVKLNNYLKFPELTVISYKILIYLF